MHFKIFKAFIFEHFQTHGLPNEVIIRGNKMNLPAAMEMFTSCLNSRVIFTLSLSPYNTIGGIFKVIYYKNTMILLLCFVFRIISSSAWILHFSGIFVDLILMHRQMLGLKLPTDPRWVNIVETNISEILRIMRIVNRKPRPMRSISWFNFLNTLTWWMHCLNWLVKNCSTFNKCIRK